MAVLVSSYSFLTGKLTDVKSLQASAYTIMYKEMKSHILKSWHTTKCQKKQKKKKRMWSVCFFFLSVQSRGQCHEKILQMRTLKYSFDCTNCVLLNINDLSGAFCQMSVVQMSS